MKLRRIVLLVLLVLALGVLALYFIWPNDGMEWVCYFFVVPVLIWNMWEWFDPEIMENLYGKR